MTETAKELINRHARQMNRHRRQLAQNRLRRYPPVSAQRTQTEIDMSLIREIPFWQRLDIQCYAASSVAGILTVLSWWSVLSRNHLQ